MTEILNELHSISEELHNAGDQLCNLDRRLGFVLAQAFAWQEANRPPLIAPSEEPPIDVSFATTTPSIPFNRVPMLEDHTTEVSFEVTPPAETPVIRYTK